MEDIKSNLEEKGWNKKDIKKAVKIIEHAKKNKHPLIKRLDKIIYWISLLLAVFSNFIISLSLIPALMVLDGIRLYAIIITLGISVGLLFELLIRDIDNIKSHHHFLFAVVIPLMALLNFIILSSNMNILMGIQIRQNPIIIGSIYSISFLVPFFIYKIFLKIK